MVNDRQKSSRPRRWRTENGKAEAAAMVERQLPFVILPQARPAVKGWLNGRA